MTRAEIRRARRAHLRRLLTHKRLVYRFGRRMGLSRWRLIRHDLSAFSRREFTPTAIFLATRGPAPDAVCQAFEAAYNYHCNANPHHWQFWLAVTDLREPKAIDAPDDDVREMAADLLAYETQSPGAAAFWFNNSAASVHPRVVARLINFLAVYGDLHLQRRTAPGASPS